MSNLRLPVTWPLALAFMFYPIWWLLGIGAFSWLMFAVPIFVALIARRWSRAPAVVLVWFAFSSWVLLSGMQLHGGTRILTFSYRLSLYVVGVLFFMFVYNLPRSTLINSKVLRILTIFWMTVIVCGYAGIALRSFTYIPPFEHLLPGGLRNKPFTQELVRPVFAEVQNFLGYPIPRPSAPFAYTNNWGANIAVLTPIALSSIIVVGRGLRRRVLIGFLVASVVPMVFSLNRGMFLSLGVGMLYVSIRLAMRGRIGALAAIFSVVALAAIVVVVTPLGSLVVASFSSTHGHSNSTRLNLYQEATTGVNASPIFGHGAPQQAVGATNAPAIGTQGQLWMVLYSDGYPALALFIAFFLIVIWQTRRVRGTAGLLLHAVPVIGLAQIAFYGWLPVELQVLMVTAALTYRLCLPPLADAARTPAEITGLADLETPRVAVS